MYSGCNASDGVQRGETKRLSQGRHVYESQVWNDEQDAAGRDEERVSVRIVPKVLKNYESDIPLSLEN